MALNMPPSMKKQGPPPCERKMLGWRAICEVQFGKRDKEIKGTYWVHLCGNNVRNVVKGDEKNKSKNQREKDLPSRNCGGCQRIRH